MWVTIEEEYGKAVTVKGSKLRDANHSLSVLLLDGVWML